MKIPGKWLTWKNRKAEVPVRETYDLVPSAAYGRVPQVTTAALWSLGAKGLKLPVLSERKRVIGIDLIWFYHGKWM
jgi:hypothetical protein